jgi:hypothetical protein
MKFIVCLHEQLEPLSGKLYALIKVLVWKNSLEPELYVPCGYVGDNSYLITVPSELRVLFYVSVISLCGEYIS